MLTRKGKEDVGIAAFDVAIVQMSLIFLPSSPPFFFPSSPPTLPFSTLIPTLCPFSSFSSPYLCRVSGVLKCYVMKCFMSFDCVIAFLIFGSFIGSCIGSYIWLIIIWLLYSYIWLASYVTITHISYTFSLLICS